MTDVYGPFDGANWTQSNWYRHAQMWTASGVYSASDLPLTTSGLSVTIGTGRASVRGSGFERSGTPTAISVPANTNASLSRRDRIVLRRDLSAKTTVPTLIQGTPSASPTAPAIQQVETGQWDLPLWSFLVPPNSGTTISGLVDERQVLIVAPEQTLYRRITGTASGTLASGTSVDLCAAQTIPASPFGMSVNYWIDVDAVVHASSVPGATGGILQIKYDGVLMDGDSYTNPGTGAQEHTFRARSGVTVADNSAHSITATISASAGTLTFDTAYQRVLILLRPYATF